MFSSPLSNVKKKSEIDNYKKHIMQMQNIGFLQYSLRNEVKLVRPIWPSGTSPRRLFFTTVEQMSITLPIFDFCALFVEI